MSTNSHYYTENDSAGRAKFTEQVPSATNVIDTPIGLTLQYLYSNANLLPDVNSDADLKLTADHRLNGLPGGRVTVDDGVSAAIISFKPGAVSPMHRTRTVDIIVVLEGEILLELDDGEQRHLKQGDTIVQRGTIHKWTNVTPNDGWCRMFGVALDAKRIVTGDGKELPEEFK